MRLLVKLCRTPTHAYRSVMKKDNHRFTHTRTWHITHSNMHKNTRTQTHTNTYNINAKHTLRTHQDPEIDKREKKRIAH